MRIANIFQLLFCLEGPAFVTELYRELLDREPDPGGLAHHAELLAAGMSKMELAARILQSPESVDRNHMDDQAPPNGLNTSTLDWIKNADSAYTRYTVFEPGPRSVPTDPKGLDDRHLDNFHEYYRLRKPWPQFVSIIPGGKAVGSHGAVITPDRKLLWDVSAEYNLPPESNTVMKALRLPPMTYCSDTVAVVTTAGPYNYYHWMFDVLPRFELLRRSGIHVDSYMINRGSGLFPYQDETLNALGIPAHKQVDCDNDTHVKAKQLVISSMAGYSGHPPEWACQFLRQKLLVDRNIQPLPGRPKIYVSRSSAGYRRILNDHELAETLRGYGFITVQLEKFSVAEQAQLFASAEAVVSPHGASLTNLIFCRPGTKIVELFSPNYVSALYWIIGCQMKLDYFYLEGEAAQKRSDADYTIDVNAVDRMMQLTGCRA